MTRTELVGLMRQSQFWVEATVAPGGGPQAAVIGVVVSDRLELFFDTLVTSRKYGNLRREPRMALVMWHEAWTIQLEGVADEPRGEELARLKELYFGRFPDGVEREKQPDIAYVRVRPTWVRHSDFAEVPPRIVELSSEELERLPAGR